MTDTQVVATVDSPAYDGRFDVIAEQSAKDAKRVVAAGKRLSSLVDEIAHTVFLAYSTGYVHTERTSKDAPLPLGSIRQNDYVKSFGPSDKGDDDNRGPSVTTIKRWKRCGAAIAAGIGTKDPVYRALKSGNVAASLAKVLDVPAPDEAKIRKAHAALVKAEAKALLAGASATDDDAKSDDDSDSDSREARPSLHDATNADLVAAYIAVVTSLKVESLTPDEYTAVKAGYDALGEQFTAYDAMATATA